LQFDDDALDLFVLLTGGNTRQIETELEKLDIFLGSSTGSLPVGKAGVSSASLATSPRDESVGLTGEMAAIPKARMAAPRITADLVRKLVPLSRAGVIFELSNALAARDLQL